MSDDLLTMGTTADAQTTTVSEPSTNQVIQPWQKPMAEYLPEELQKEPFFQQYKTLEEFARSAKETKSFVGKKFEEIIPGETASEEEWQRFRKIIGAPGDAAEYSFENPKNLQIDGDAEKWFRETAHKLGFTKKQANALFSGWNEYMSNRAKGSSAESRNGLMREWKSDFEGRLGTANAALKTLSPELQQLISTSRANDIVVVKLLAELGSRLQEDKPLTQKSDGLPNSLEVISGQISEINNKLRGVLSGNERQFLMNQKVQLLNKQATLQVNNYPGNTGKK